MPTLTGTEVHYSEVKRGYTMGRIMRTLGAMVPSQAAFNNGLYARARIDGHTNGERYRTIAELNEAIRSVRMVATKIEDADGNGTRQECGEEQA